MDPAAGALDRAHTHALRWLDSLSGRPVPPRADVAEVIERYRELGYDFLAITDHDDRIDDNYWFNIPSGDDRMLVLTGIELDYRPLCQHVGKIMGDRETLYVLNHPARYGLNVAQILYRIGVICEAGLPIHAVASNTPGAPALARSRAFRSTNDRSSRL